jgi:cytoplasmic iron level regulating protein YaaA (DUF328/UPF0246 family)
VATPRRTLSNDVPILLLPPSEGKATGGAGPGWQPSSGSFGALAARRAEVVRALAAADGGDERLLGARGDTARRAAAANRRLLGAPTLPAWRRYTGVVWDHLDPATLPAAARRRIVVVSGLLGLARGDDPVPEHRLKMGADLPPLGRLARWWHADLTAALTRRARGRTVVDLLTRELRAAWTPSGVRGVAVDLVRPDGRPGGHGAKAAKGRLARAVLTDGLDALQHWDREGGGGFDLAVTEL